MRSIIGSNIFLMRKQLHFFVILVLGTSIQIGCFSPKRLITDEIVFKDGDSQTGTIIKCDSANVKIKKMDESITTIPWTNIDTIQGKKLKTFFGGVNMGVYKTPYFSVFRNESITPTSFGMEYKIGMAMRGVKLYYVNLTIIPAKPYSITKFGLGYQHYLGKTTYLKKNAFFIGTEANMMSVEYNNGPQLTFEPFTGFERKCSNTIRLHAKLGMQFNMSNKNNQTGLNLTIGVHFMRRNLTRYYKTLNSEHRQLRK